MVLPRFGANRVTACNTFYLDKAYGNDTYSYFFTVPPALHGEDIPYTYDNGPNPSVLSQPIAMALQEYITEFAMSGMPNEAGVRSTETRQRIDANADIDFLCRCHTSSCTEATPPFKT